MASANGGLHSWEDSRGDHREDGALTRLSDDGFWRCGTGLCAGETIVGRNQTFVESMHVTARNSTAEGFAAPRSMDGVLLEGAPCEIIGRLWPLESSTLS